MDVKSAFLNGKLEEKSMLNIHQVLRMQDLSTLFTNYSKRSMDSNKYQGIDMTHFPSFLLKNIVPEV